MRGPTRRLVQVTLRAWSTWSMGIRRGSGRRAGQVVARPAPAVARASWRCHVRWGSRHQGVPLRSPARIARGPAWVASIVSQPSCSLRAAVRRRPIGGTGWHAMRVTGRPEPRSKVARMAGRSPVPCWASAWCSTSAVPGSSRDQRAMPKLSPRGSAARRGCVAASGARPSSHASLTSRRAITSGSSSSTSASTRSQPRFAVFTLARSRRMGSSSARCACSASGSRRGVSAVRMRWPL